MFCQLFNYSDLMQGNSFYGYVDRVSARKLRISSALIDVITTRMVYFSSICLRRILDLVSVFVWAWLLLITNGTSRFLDLLQYKVWNLSIFTYISALFELDLSRQLSSNNFPRKGIHPWTYVCQRYWNYCHWILELSDQSTRFGIRHEGEALTVP